MNKSILLCIMVCMIVRSAPAQGPAAAPAPVQPKGIQVRAADVLAPDYVSDAVAPPDKPAAIRIVAVRGGAHSGKVVVSSGAPIRGLRATVGDLKCGDAKTSGTIPSSAVQFRCALPWGACLFPRTTGADTVYVAKAGYLGLLAETPPKEFGPGKIPVRRNGRNVVDTFGPLVPVWVTVRVPRDQAPGTYAGQITIAADGEKPVAVPIELKVLPFTLPAPADWRAWADFIESPDTLALQYGVELWSPRHWELIGRSFHYLGELGNRIVYVPLICRTNMGHEQSMVRWVKKDGGGYTCDFTILDQYLDAAEKQMGKPQIVVLYAWENYMIRKGDVATGAAAAHEQQRILEQMEKAGGVPGKGPAVTVLDPKTKAATTEYLPHYTDPASKALWKPVFAELQQRLAKRGLAKAAMLGMINDCWPTKAEVQFFKDLAPEMPWVLHAHFAKADAYGLAKVGYRAQVWSLEAPTKDKSLMGWKRPDLVARFDRESQFGAAPLHAWRFWEEYCIAGNQRGAARLGGDYWPVVKDKAGLPRGYVGDRYPESTWRNLGIYTSVLGAGAEGPQATARLEMFREGLQECEARIVIEKALSDPAAKARLGDDLAKRCQDAMAERLARMMENMVRKPGNRSGWNWPLKDHWQELSERLFTLAGEVQKKVKDSN